MKKNNYLWDESKVRYHLTETNGGPSYNWLFFPGGPGFDSSYLTSLTSSLNLPGNVWLIDLPGNGSNTVEPTYDFHHWLDIFIAIIKRFDNPILVGHSFGGMLPLIYPELEQILKGYVMLNCAPCLWLEEAAQLAKIKNLPSIDEPAAIFTQNPTPDTFNDLLIACLPYYFSPESLEQGKALLKDVPFNYNASAWGLTYFTNINFQAKWIPEKVSTLIIGGTEDCMTPCSLFDKDLRFVRDNIHYQKIGDAGHAPWIEKPADVQQAFKLFVKTLTP